MIHKEILFSFIFINAKKVLSFPKDLDKLNILTKRELTWNPSFIGSLREKRR